jgi:1,4-dihydroxy-2-naphthoyl-CoA synthase
MSEPPAALVEVERVALDRDDGVATLLRLSRPESLNAIDAEMLVGLDAALDAVEADALVRCVLVTGNGRAFSAGGDLKKYIELQRDPVAFPAFVEDLHRIFGRLRRLRVPAVALVNGVTAAGGLELLLGCDFAIAARSARIGDGQEAAFSACSRASSAGSVRPSSCSRDACSRPGRPRSGESSHVSFRTTSCLPRGSSSRSSWPRRVRLRLRTPSG